MDDEKNPPPRVLTPRARTALMAAALLAGGPAPAIPQGPPFAEPFDPVKHMRPTPTVDTSSQLSRAYRRRLLKAERKANKHKR